MPTRIPQSLKKMLEDKAYGHVVTFNANGKPELTMVWMDIDGDELLFNTAEGRRMPFFMAGDESLTRVPTRTLTSWPNVFLARTNIRIGGPLRSD
jgi:hypothetical protein